MHHHHDNVDDHHDDIRTHDNYPTPHHHEWTDNHVFATVDDPTGDDIDNYVVAYLHAHDHHDLANALDDLIQSVAAAKRTR